MRQECTGSHHLLVGIRDIRRNRRKAISLGGDADTMACIAGSIAAATPSMGVSDFILQRGYRYLEKEFAETVWAFDNACNKK